MNTTDDDRRWQRYASSGYRRVSGWLSDLAVLEFVQLMLQQRNLGVEGPVCEVGAHLGRTFILLHLLTRGAEMSVAFDLYELQDPAVGAERKRRLNEYLARHGGDARRVALMTCDSQNLTPAEVRSACQGAPRLFSIDAGRTAAAVESDMRLAAQSVCAGGLVSITDFFQEAWPEVSEGACRFMSAERSLVPVAIGGNKFFFTTSTEFAAHYQRGLAEAFGNQARPSVMFGLPVLQIRAATVRTRLARTKLWRAVRHTALARKLRTLGVRGR
jgi:hypothetical protein